MWFFFLIYHYLPRKLILVICKFSSWHSYVFLKINQSRQEFTKLTSPINFQKITIDFFFCLMVSGWTDSAFIYNRLSLTRNLFVRDQKGQPIKWLETDEKKEKRFFFVFFLSPGIWIFTQLSLIWHSVITFGEPSKIKTCYSIPYKTSHFFQAGIKTLIKLKLIWHRTISKENLVKEKAD